MTACRNSLRWVFLGTFGLLAGSGPASADPAAKEVPPTRELPADGPPPPGLVAQMGGGPFRHPGPIQAIALSVKGDRLATGCMDSSIRVWSVPEGKALLEVPGKDIVRCLAFSRDGKLLAAGGLNSVRLWQVATGNLVAELLGEPRVVSRLVFSEDDKSLLSANGDGSLRVWDVVTGKELRRFQPKPDFRVDAADLSADGNTLALGNVFEKKVRLWDVRTGKERFTLDGCAVHDQNFLTFAPDCQTVAAAFQGKAVPGGFVVRIYEVATGKQLRELSGFGAGVTGTAFAPNSKTLLAALNDGTSQLWEVAPDKESRRVRSFPASALIAAFSGDGKVLAFTNRRDRTVCLWDLAADKEVGSRQGHQGEIRATVFSPDRKVLATAGEDDTIRLWDAETGVQLEAFRGFTPVVFSPDGKLLAYGFGESSDRAVIRVWDMATRIELRQLYQAGYPVRHIAFSPDSKVLFSGWKDGRIRVWEVATGRLLRSLQLPGRDQVTALTLSPDGSTLATGALELGDEKPTPSHEHTIRLWNAANGKRLLTLRGPMDHPFKPVFPGLQFPVAGLTFSPDGKFLISAHEDQKVPIRLWEVASGQELRALPPVTGPGVIALALSPDGKVLATGNYSGDAQREDHLIHLWDTSTCQEIHQFKGHSGGVRTLVFSPDGKRLAAGTPAGTAMVWDVSQLRGSQPKVPDLGPQQWAELWADLAERDASRARRATLTLIAAGEKTVNFLKGKVQPAPEMDVKRVPKLIADLDNNKFDVREAASNELQSMGTVVEPALREALANATSAEARRRLDELLAIPGIVKSPEALRRVRAIHVLEQIGSPPARETLKKLAQGAPAAYETLDAQMALERLAKQKTVNDR